MDDDLDAFFDDVENAVKVVQQQEIEERQDETAVLAAADAAPTETVRKLPSSNIGTDVSDAGAVATAVAAGGSPTALGK